MAPTAAFLFLDECSYAPLDLAALTGILVSLDQYADVRDAMCQITWDALAPAANTVPAPIELHARSLLSDLADRNAEELDRARLDVLSAVVDIVNNDRLQVFRVAYLNRSEIATVMKSDPNLYSLNFLGIQFGLQAILADTLLIPVMDGIPGSRPSAKPPRIDSQLIRAFAQQVRWVHHARRHEPLAKSLSIENVVNLAEPVFADSTHSCLLQLVDLVSFLLLQLERDELETTQQPSLFRAATLGIARRLNAERLSCWKGKMAFV